MAEMLSPSTSAEVAGQGLLSGLLSGAVFGGPLGALIGGAVGLMGASERRSQLRDEAALSELMTQRMGVLQNGLMQASQFAVTDAQKAQVSLAQQELAAIGQGLVSGDQRVRAYSAAQMAAYQPVASGLIQNAAQERAGLTATQGAALDRRFDYIQQQNDELRRQYAPAQEAINNVVALAAAGDE